MKNTKIVATIGPISNSYEMLQKLGQAGVNIFRLNFSHGSHKWHGEVIKHIKRLNEKSEQNIAIMLDTKGPEIRTADLKAPIKLKKGSKITLTVDHSEYEESRKIGVNYDEFINDVEVGEKILVDSGVMTIKVQKKTKTDIICEVLEGGELGSRRHLNLPMKDVSLTSITKKDWEDIKFGIEMGVDFIALSFVRTANDIMELKKYLKSKNANIDVIAKIESFEATKHIGTICEASDAVMVARGDLGAEIPFSHVPRIQRDIIETCKKFQKPVIVATQMLESMIRHPMPTRAEITDVSTAVFQRADCVMLSGETATGKFPVKTVKNMTEIAIETEKEYLENRPFREITITSNRGEFAKLSAQIVSDMPDITALLVITRSGFTAKQVASFRPKRPIFAFTNTSSTRRKMQILWGVEAHCIQFSTTPEKTIIRAIRQFREINQKWKGKKFVLVADSLVNGKFIPTLQVRKF